MPTNAKKVFDRLLEAWGPQAWWPAESPFEVLVGAILVQNTAWRNVEKAIDNLRQRDLLDNRRLLQTTPDELETLIRPAGPFRVKARRLRHLLQFFADRYDSSIEAMRKADPAALRQELLAIHGVGPETADSILLYALHHPVMVVDAYTLRVWARHGWASYRDNYHQLQQTVREQLPADPQVYNELHALIVELGKTYCRPQPRCEQCPLCDLLPEGGWIAPP